MISWFAKNPVAANILMFAIVIAGLVSATSSIPVETFPIRESDKITISTSFRGATPQTAQDSITLRVEEAIADIEGITEIESRSSEGQSTVIAEILENYNSREILDDIKVRVDALNTLPSDAENPIVSINVRNSPVIFVAVQGDVKLKTLREVASKFHEGLLKKDEISDVDLQGVANFQMNIEIAPQVLDDYNLTLAQVGLAIRAGASDISAGNLDTSNGEILVRSDGQAYTAEEFAAIPIISNPLGTPITLGDIASIDDGFEEKDLLTTFDDKPTIMLEVRRIGYQSAIKVAKQTRDYIDEFSQNLPTGITVSFWDDDSEYLKTRIQAVLDSGIYGGILVMLLLSLFLRPAVAFWVFLGIPISFMGAFLFMPHVNGTFNVISLFAFIMVLGIVVDDAIVTGENIYRKIREGMEPLEASIVGTKEITIPVTFGILTTVVAFIPLNYLDGTRFAFIGSQMPLIVIPVMLMSLVESKLILPAHMSHIKVRKQDSSMSWLGRTQQSISRGLERFVIRYYRPFLAKCVRNKSITLTSLLAASAIIVTSVSTGHIAVRPVPKVESDTLRLFLTMPESTGFETTNKYIQEIIGHVNTLKDKYTDEETGEGLILNVFATSGSSGRTLQVNIGSVKVALQQPEDRKVNITTTQLGRELRKMIGEIPGAKSLSVRSEVFKSDNPINVELSGADPHRLNEVIKKLKTEFKSYPGIFDIQDNYSGGKEELKISLKPRAYTLGLRLNDVAQQVRNAVFGFQAQRIQRGRDELRVMVLYPREHRSSLDDLSRLRIRVPDSDQDVALSEVATVTSFESPSTLYRLNRVSILNVTADIDKEITSIDLVLADVDEFLADVLQDYPDVKYRYDGEVEDTAKTNAKLQLGVVIILVAIYVLLAIPFKSYGQPLIVMSIIPFGLIGAILGHIITFQDISILSIFGMLALIGVLVNDSLVLVDYINKRRQQGIELVEAVLSAASTRFRPVILTSITTFAGLAPILLDGSQQAKWLKPMATSLGFGIIFATIMTLIIVPVNYLAARQIKYACINQSKSLWQIWLRFWNKGSIN